MKEFIKKCPFVFSLIISGFLVFDFYMVENDYLKIMPEGSNRVTMSESEEILHDKEGDTTLSDELDRDKVPDISQDPLLWREPDNSTNDNSIEQDHSGEQQNFGEQNKSQEQQNAEEQNNSEEQQEPVEPFVGVTEFLSYEPSDVKSPYFKDPGKKALTTTYPYETVDRAYFQDAAFIGDSRTTGSIACP